MVSLRKAQVELGVQICGGNLCGIFVENLEEDSPAKLADVLMPGDMILEVSFPLVLWISVIECKSLHLHRRARQPGG